MATVVLDHFRNFGGRVRSCDLRHQHFVDVREFSEGIFRVEGSGGFLGEDWAESEERSGHHAVGKHFLVEI